MLARAVVLPVALVSLSVLAGCSDDGPQSEGPTPSTSPPSSPSTPRSSTGAGPEVDRLVKKLQAGIGERGRARVSVRTTGVLDSRATGALAYDSRGSRLRMRSVVPALGSGATLLVVTPDAAFVSAPGATPQGKFVELSPEDPRLQQLAGGGQLDPRESLQGFRRGLASVEQIGRPQIDGVATTRYRLEVDAAASLKAQGQSAPPGLPTTLTYDAWLDDQGRIRRLTTSIAGSQIVVEFSDWGQPVRIEAPPNSSVIKPRRG